MANEAGQAGLQQTNTFKLKTREDVEKLILNNKRAFLEQIESNPQLRENFRTLLQTWDSSDLVELGLRLQDRTYYTLQKSPMLSIVDSAPKNFVAWAKNHMLQLRHNPYHQLDSFRDYHQMKLDEEALKERENELKKQRQLEIEAEEEQKKKEKIQQEQIFMQIMEEYRKHLTDFLHTISNHAKIFGDSELIDELRKLDPITISKYEEQLNQLNYSGNKNEAIGFLATLDAAAAEKPSETARAMWNDQKLMSPEVKEELREHENIHNEHDLSTRLSQHHYRGGVLMRILGHGYQRFGNGFSGVLKGFASRLNALSNSPITRILESGLSGDTQGFRTAVVELRARNIELDSRNQAEKAENSSQYEQDKRFEHNSILNFALLEAHRQNYEENKAAANNNDEIKSIDNPEENVQKIEV